MNRPKVLLLYTGGTIGMVKNAKSGALAPIDFNHLKDYVPELNRLYIDIDVQSILPIIDSSNVNPDTWKRLAAIIFSQYSKYDGFVILHGSDTMAYTGSALSFMLKNVAKPIILTGSQLPIGTIRTDGKENLITAIEIAAAKKDGRAIVPEVAIYFEYSLYRANRTTKVSAENFEAFQSPNYPNLVEAGVHLKYNSNAIKPLPSEPFELIDELEEAVTSIRIFPGMFPEAALRTINAPGLKGLVLETYGSGNAPELSWLDSALKNAIEKGLVVLNISQCNSGSVVQEKYATGKHLNDIGVVGGENLSFEAAITKLMVLLGNADVNEQDRVTVLKQNWSGELD